MPGDPADVSGAPEGVLIVVVKDPLEGLVNVHQVACLGMHHTLGLASAAAGVQDKERVLSIHYLRLAVGSYAVGGHQLLPPEIPALHHVARYSGPLGHNYLFNVRTLSQGSIRILL